MTRPNDDANDRSRARLRDVIARLGEEGLRGRVDETWTASSLLAHVAFWDRLYLERWRAVAAGGQWTELPEGYGHLINDAMLPEWIALSPKKSARLAVEAADAIDHWIAHLSDDEVAAMQASGRDRLIDRSAHRTLHLDEIERAFPV